MKRTWRIIGIAAVFMLILGLALVVAAASLGGSLTALRGRIGVTDISRDFGGERVSSLDIRMSVGSLTISPGRELFVEARDVAQGSFVCEVIDGVLTIRDEWESGWALDVSRGLRFDSYEPGIHVYLPEGFIADEADFNVAAGVVRVEGLTAKSAGITVNAGEITVIGLDAGETELLCNAGAARLSGRVRESGSFVCNVGRVELELDGLQRDYDISGSVGLGRLEVGGSEWNVSGSASMGNPDGVPLELEVDLGEMTLRFNG